MSTNFPYLEPELNKILHLLAKRAHHFSFDLGNQQWLELFHCPASSFAEIRYKCLICGSIIGSKYEQHGLWHLKQHNLLPFL